MSDSLWSPSQPLPIPAGDIRELAIATIGETVHVVWTQGRTLCHAYLANKTWSEPRSIGVGGQASLAGTPDGRLHCLFSATLFDNSEIYHTTWNGAQWSLPEIVSRTAGASIYPALAADADGILYAAWTDTTPGYSAIYSGHQDGDLWTSTPVPNATGSHPSLAIGPNYEVYVAWESRLPDTQKYDIYCAVCAARQWGLPENVSDSGQRHSIYPQVITNNRGACDILWQEDRGEVFGIQHADRRPDGWSTPDDASGSPSDCRFPHLMTNLQGHLQIVWAEGQTLYHRVRPSAYDAAWWKPEVGAEGCAALSDLAAALTAKGSLYVVWAGYTDGDQRQLSCCSREPVFKSSSMLPLVGAASTAPAVPAA